MRRELNLCQHGSENKIAEPLILQDEDGREYEVRFLCGKCLPRLDSPRSEAEDRVETGGMEIFLGYERD